MISFEGKKLNLDNNFIEFDYPIKEMEQIDDITIVRLGDYDKSWGQFQNLIGIDSEGKILWKSPELYTWSNSYWDMQIKDGEIKGYDGAYIRTIDPKTGKILKSIFTK